MGGYGSGRDSSRPTADASLGVDLAWMIRTRRATPGSRLWGDLQWTCNGMPSGSISYEADMIDPDHARLVLNYKHGSGEAVVPVRQVIALTHTRPNYGGRRWWMICPYGGGRCAKLYLPPSGDRFASRKAWGLAYQSQRIAEAEQPFEALFRLQRRLGGPLGWEAGLAERPRGMWHRSYARCWDEYDRLDRHCAFEMMAVMQRLEID